MNSVKKMFQFLIVLSALLGVAGCNSDDKSLNQNQNQAPNGGIQVIGGNNGTGGADAGTGTGGGVQNDGSIKGSCLASRNVCVEFIGAGFTEERMHKACDEGGQLASVSCPANSVLACRRLHGTPAEFVMYMYELSIEEARQACVMQGGQPV